MKKLLIILLSLSMAFIFSGCKKEEIKPIMSSVTVFEDGECLLPSGFDMIITVDGEEIPFERMESSCEFEEKTGELKGVVKFPDWVEVEFGFLNNGDYSEVAIEVYFEHRENELYAKQIIKAKKNGSSFEKANEGLANIKESQISVFAEAI